MMPSANTELKEIIMKDINMQSFNFSLSISNYSMTNNLQPEFLGNLVRNIDSCLDTFINDDDIQPIRSLSLDTSYILKDDDINNKFIAYVNLRLAEKFLSKNDYIKAMRYYNRGITYRNLKDPSELETNIIDEYNRKKTQEANKERWHGHVKKLRHKYLELDEARQKELGKKLTIKKSAMWIYNNHNAEDLEYETIRDHLSKARKGIFNNK